jgi:hypothetical protein
VSSKDDLQNAMLEEIREALNVVPIPAQAMTLIQLVETLGVNRHRLGPWLKEEIKANRWASGRIGSTVYYWKV